MMRLFFLLIFLSTAACPLPAFATEVQEITSPGGIKAWLVEEHALPLVAVKIAFKESGSVVDPDNKEGLANMAAALLLEGAGDLDSHRFNEDIENLAIRLNVGADEDELYASMESLSEHKDKAFNYLALALTQPRFDDAAIERVRAQELSILQQEEEDPGYILHRKWQNLAYGSHPYSRAALGTRDSLALLDKSDFTHFTQHYFSRENMIVAVVGDITPAELGQLLDANFSKLSAHYIPDTQVQDVKLPIEAKQLVVDYDVPQTNIIFGGNGLKRDDADFYAAYVMNQILGGGGALTSKLGIELRQKRGLAYSVHSELNLMVHSASWFGGFATRNEKVGEALQVLRATLKDFSDNGPSDKEMEDAKKHIVGSFVLNLDSNTDIANFLIVMQLQHLGRDYLDKRNALMLAVTKDEVKAVAKKLLNPGHLLVAMVGKPQLEVK